MGLEAPAADGEDRIATIPNVISAVRLACVPLFLYLLLGIEERRGAAILLATLGATDWVDGYIARSRGAITTFGKLMDPIADKLLVVAALVSLVSLDRLPAWVAMVIIARELAVTMSRMAATGQGVVISANRWGKAKTALQVLTIFLLIAVNGSPAWLDVLVYLTVGVTVVSGVEYFFGLRRSLAARERSSAEA